MGRYYDSYWPPYVPVAERRRRAAKKVAKMKKNGQVVSPVEIEGRKIATTFWGDAWCTNLEAYSDYSNRLPRGRTYVRNGSVLDLQIDAGQIHSLVSGTELYRIEIEIEPLPKKKWEEINGQCAGQIGSLVELLQGTLSKSVMEIVTRKGEGLFPSPREITLSCSCPDWAVMCKHVAATLYGVGARLDDKPELLFTLRGVDPTEMVEAAIDQPTAADRASKGRLLETGDLSSLFGVDIEMESMPTNQSSKAKITAKKSKRSTNTRKPAASKPPRKGKRFTQQEKKALLAKYDSLRESGINAYDAAKEVGVSYIMLRSWVKKNGSARTTKASKAVGPDKETISSSDGLSMVLPNGNRIEGLTLEQVIKIVKSV